MEELVISTTSVTYSLVKTLVVTNTTTTYSEVNIVDESFEESGFTTAREANPSAGRDLWVEAITTVTTHLCEKAFVGAQSIFLVVYLDVLHKSCQIISQHLLGERTRRVEELNGGLVALRSPVFHFPVELGPLGWFA